MQQCYFVQHNLSKIKTLGGVSGWRYDQNFQVVDYTFSKLDLTTMANISGGDRRLWVHLVSAWVISWFVWRVRICGNAIALHRFLPFPDLRRCLPYLQPGLGSSHKMIAVDLTVSPLLKHSLQ